MRRAKKVQVLMAEGGCVGEMWALKAFKAYKDLANGEPAKSTVTEEPGYCSSH